MSAGTITLTNGSAVVGGSGTSFATELAAGDFIVSTVGGVDYTLPVKTVDGNTQVTLVSNFTGPTQAGAAWSAVPRVALNMVTAALVAQSAEALRGLNYDKQNWQSIFSGNGNVTVTLPDRTKWTGPAWNSITTILSGKAAKGANDDITSLSGLTTALSLEQGGTGSTTASGARKNLGLVDESGLIPVSIGGTGAKTAAGARAGIGLKNGFPIAEYNATNETVIDNLVSKMRGFSLATLQNSGQMTGDFYEIPQSAPTLWVGANDTWFLMSVHYLNRGIRIMSGYGSAGVSTTRLLLDNLSTTVDANGFIKKASPIARLTDNPEIMPASFLDDFKLSGYAGTNCEAEGVTAEKLSTGVYEVRGAKGLCSEGWTLEVPQDENGNRLCFVTTETSENGTVTVHVFKRRFDIDSAMIVAGEPMDIPRGRWIDLRLDMPENSVWNQRQKTAMGTDDVSG
ncbi:phage tail fiber protein [Enterobacter roggenkampii]|uniref:phage tail fiber protein n=1 Tax=Enterobacter roggenkampii TaxID=1812935 RepID=UPI002075EDE9|nr:phage tail protein [Enterobacter roggenkampii]MCM7081050.1 phage tail protein [Enterobacter roggenkampii]